MKLRLDDFEPVFSNDGYRPNVGIIIANQQGKVFWARRVSGDGWQFPQGGLKPDETLVEGMYRELHEETGLCEQQVRLVAHTKRWLHYDLPKRYLRHGANRGKTSFRGQKQVWFLLTLEQEDAQPDFGVAEKPEFDQWRWVSHRYALDNIVSFKRDVYKRAMQELACFLPNA